MFTRFVANSEKCRKYAFLGGPPRLLRYYKGGVIEIYYNTTRGGGLPDLLQYYKGEGGVSRDPKFVLRNIWTAPYGSAPENSRSLMSHWCGQCWNLSWWKCRQSVSLSICGSFRHIFHLVISIQGLVKMLFRVDIQVDQGVKVLRCWHPVSTP